MRRPILITLVAMAASFTLASEALAAPKASVTDEVKKGESITVTASDCQSGSGYTAHVDVRITNLANGQLVHFQTFPTPPGVMKIQLNQPGDFNAQVTCRHEFDGGGSDTWYSETEPVKVTGLTRAELDKCKNKRTRKARKRCRERQKKD